MRVQFNSVGLVAANKVKAIKLIRNLTGEGLKEASHIFEAMAKITGER